MTPNQIIYQVDAFTDKPFKGNPAGVCILEKEPEESWMRNIAMEMNLSETAFIFPLENGLNIRFFTPSAEVKLCGHATLSSAHIIFETGIKKSGEELILISKAGELRVRKDGDLITMNFPLYDVKSIKNSPDFKKITGAEALELYSAGFKWTLALLKDESTVRSLIPDFAALKNSVYNDLIVTAPSDDPGFDFCVRCFAPGVGINEDPVTGSAHCALVPFWSARTGKSKFVSHQVSAREGILYVGIVGNRVEISGKAVTVMKAELCVE
jgi:PhzF family phenazine biosynthesis protein